MRLERRFGAILMIAYQELGLVLERNGKRSKHFQPSHNFSCFHRLPLDSGSELDLTWLRDIILSRGRREGWLA